MWSWETLLVWRINSPWWFSKFMGKSIWISIFHCHSTQFVWFFLFVRMSKVSSPSITPSPNLWPSFFFTEWSIVLYFRNCYPKEQWSTYLGKGLRRRWKPGLICFTYLVGENAVNELKFNVWYAARYRFGEQKKDLTNSSQFQPPVSKTCFLH